MLTQVQLERRMYSFGRARANRVIDNNEQGGRASNNPYASVIYRRFVLPLAEKIKQDLETKKPGRSKAHVALLAPLDPEAIAFLSVRSVLNSTLNEKTRAGGRSIVTDVGRCVYHELLLRLFEGANPALFHTLVNSLDRRLSKQEQHRVQVLRAKAQEAGIRFPEWGCGAVTQAGSYLINALENLGMVQVFRTASGKRQGIDIRLCPDVVQLIETVCEMARETMPYFLPCVEPPKDWVAVDDGGWHTDEMRRMQPFAVAARGAWRDTVDQGSSTPLRAINALQRVRWQVNSEMFDAVRLIAKHYDMEEIIGQAEYPAPARPDFLDRVSADEMTEVQLHLFNQWKREKREWHTQMKLRSAKAGRFSTALRVAGEFVEYPAIHFVYFADFRGRLYTKTTGVDPQGSDLQKALLRFADGKPLDTPEAEQWFLCHGANRWGHDKVSLEDRARWVLDRAKMIEDFADDPVNNAGWMEADKPLQFLAWAQEFVRWRHSPHDFVSHLPVGMDGTCNGLQNFSAMLRDEVGGKATNLVPGEKPRDIYQEVAEVTAFKLRQSAPDEAGLRDTWLRHGINRSLVKRSVMTRPYGSTRFSCADFIVEDYFKAGKAPEFAKEDYSRAATFLSHFVWEAIAEVVVKANEAMDWLQKASSQIMAEGHEEVWWTTPSGFPVLQWYPKRQMRRVRTALCGNAFLRIAAETSGADKSKHRNGIAPNFIHSYDAAHLHLTTVAAAADGLALSMIHDDYGTHAADAPRLARIIRETFVAMYEGCAPLEELSERYGLPDPPKPGNLDLRAVLQSRYFFA